MQDIIERYLQAWNETDASARRELVAALWAADGSYTDPLADVRGPDAIASLMGAAQQQPSAAWPSPRSAGRWTPTTTRRGSPGTWGRTGASRS